MNFEKTFGIVDIYKLAVWTAHEDGGEFLIAPMGNVKQIEENLKRMVDGKNAADGMSLYEQKLMSCDIMASTILLGWKGIDDADGDTQDYTTELGANALYNHEAFRTFVTDTAIELADGTVKKEENIVKN